MKDEQTVLYNGSCPICAREIAAYERYCDARDLPVRFEAMQSADLETWGVNADAAARRLHVLHNGAVISGVPAFAALWSSMPRFRWLAALVSAPGVRPIAVAVYDGLLAPILYRMHKRRQRRSRVLAADRHVQ